MKTYHGMVGRHEPTAGKPIPDEVLSPPVPKELVASINGPYTVTSLAQCQARASSALSLHTSTLTEYEREDASAGAMRVRALSLVEPVWGQWGQVFSRCQVRRTPHPS